MSVSISGEGSVTGIDQGLNVVGVVTATQVKVGSAVTIHSGGFQVGSSDIHSTGLTVNQINATGVITATSFVGSGANLTGIAGTANVVTNSLVVSGVTTVAAGSTAAPTINPTGDSNTGIFFPSADTIAFGEGGAEAARIDSGGRLLIGTSSARSNFYNGSNTPKVQIEGTDGLSSSLSLVANANATFFEHPRLILAKAQGFGIGNNGALSNGDVIADISFQGSDGTEFVEGARIRAETDSTTGANDMPGRLVFSTTADGSSSPTEAMRINNQREVLIGTTTRTANGGVLQVSNGITFPATQSACTDPNTLDDYEEGTWTPTMGYATAYGTQTGKYVKVGRTVSLWFEIQVTNFGGVTTASTWITSLPFSIDKVTGCWGAIINAQLTDKNWRIGPWTAGPYGLGLWMEGGGSTAGIQINTNNFDNYSALIGGTLGTSFTFRGGMTYISTT